MTRRNLGWLPFALLILYAMGACAPTPVSPEPPEPEMIYTAAAQTVVAHFTQVAAETAVAQLTEFAQPPTPDPTPTVLTTSDPNTGFTTPTSPPQTLTDTPAPPLAAATPTAPPCDWALFVGDISVRDNAVFAPGAAFTKIWRLKNIGTCTWTSAYSLVFVGGNLMGEGSVLALPGDVYPGDTVDIALDLNAPSSPGAYRAEWMLRNGDGRLFGTDADAQQPIRVQIQVAAYENMPGYAYDFAANYCAAEWFSETRALSCPGLIGSPDGWVALLGNPVLESRWEDEMALLTRPNSGPNGWVSGFFPGYRVKDGDRFMAEIGCLSDSPGCDVVFSLDYRVGDGPVWNLGAWRETYDGATTHIDLNLSSLANRPVQFIFSVSNLGLPDDANAFWLIPHIHGSQRIQELVLTWHQEGGPADLCNEVKVYRNDIHTGEAQAFSCEDTYRSLGAVQLTSDEMRQITEMVNRLKGFDAEIYRPSASGEALITWINFTGLGSADASNADIQTLNNLAEQLLGTINR